MVSGSFSSPSPGILSGGCYRNPLVTGELGRLPFTVSGEPSGGGSMRELTRHNVTQIHHPEADGRQRGWFLCGLWLPFWIIKAVTNGQKGA